MKKILASVGAGALIVLGSAGAANAVPPFDVDQNKETYWEALYGVECDKTELKDGTKSFDTTGFGHVIVKYGTTIEELVVGGGYGYDGVYYFDKDLSWIITCDGDGGYES